MDSPWKNAPDSHFPPMSLPWSKHSAWPMEHGEKPFPCGWSCLWRLRVQGCVGLELPPASFGSKVLHVFKGGCWDELGSGCGSFQDVDYALLGAGKQVQCDTSSIPNLMEHIPARGPASPWPSTPALGVSQRCCCAPWGRPWSKSHCSCWKASQDGAGRADSSFLIQGWPHKTRMSTALVPLAASEGMGNVLLTDVSSGLQQKRERKQGGCLRKAGMAQGFRLVASGWEGIHTKGRRGG